MRNTSKKLMGVLVILLLVTGFGLAATPAAAVEYDCSTSTFCNAGDACDIAAEQSSDDVDAVYVWTGATELIWAIAEPNTLTEERSILTTCATVSLTAYTAGATAGARVTDCQWTQCNVWAWFKVLAEDVDSGAVGGWCLGYVNCYETNGLGQATATKTGITILVPHTHVFTSNCDYAIVKTYGYPGGTIRAEANPGCTETHNHVGFV